jgi:hypothetical protein
MLEVLTEEEVLKIELKWPANASAIHCVSVIILFPTSIWVMD